MTFTNLMKQPHLRCEKGDINEYCLLPGDPARAIRISKLLTDVRHIGFNRGYDIYSGYYKGVAVTVCSTGMGGASIAIAIHELVNCGAKFFIRVGSCGSLQKKIKIGDTVLPVGAVRSESTSMLYYPREHPAKPDPGVFEALKKSGKSFNGFINSHDGFYHKGSDQMDDFWSSVGLIASDFETAPLFIISEYLGVKAGCVLNVLSNYASNDAKSVGDYASGEKISMRGEEKSIMIALSAIKKLRDKNG